MGNSALIPVFLNWDQSTEVTQAYLDSDGNVSMKIPASALTDSIENLVVTNQIRGLSVSVSYLAPDAEMMGLDKKETEDAPTE